jgi:hypothetical protein
VLESYLTSAGKFFKVTAPRGISAPQIDATPHWLTQEHRPHGTGLLLVASGTQT